MIKIKRSPEALLHSAQVPESPIIYFPQNPVSGSGGPLFIVQVAGGAQDYLATDPDLIIESDWISAADPWAKQLLDFVPDSKMPWIFIPVGVAETWLWHPHPLTPGT